MSDVHEMIEEAEGADSFITFSKTHPGYVLAHIFCNAKGERTEIEIGYYSPSEDKIASVSLDPVVIKQPEEVFKESGTIARLAIDDVTLGLEDVRKLASAHREEKYPAHPVLQEICVLQQQDGPVWNLTLVTHTLQMLLLRYNAGSGKLLKEELRNIMDLRA